MEKDRLEKSPNKIRVLQIEGIDDTDIVSHALPTDCAQHMKTHHIAVLVRQETLL